mgnify:CR=1 FL=1
MGNISRREFIQFLGASSAAAISPLGVSSVVKRVIHEPNLFPSSIDDLIVTPLLKKSMLISWGDRISKDDTFGFNNDYNAIIPLSKTRALLWTNHEYVNPLFIHGVTDPANKTKELIEQEMYNVGGSIIEIKKGKKGNWTLVENSKYNKRISGLTKIPFAQNLKIAGSNNAMGTLANCAGGTTPWNTVLTCEENYDGFYGEREHGESTISDSNYGWEKFYPNPPEHYGWVVEIEPKTAKSKKLVSLGRFQHECATVTTSKQGSTVCYSGDDKAGEFLYKFVSNKQDSLEEGILYVANTSKGKWIPIDINLSPVLKEHFNSTVEALTHCRKSGRILGATPLDRPEDIEVHPKTKDIFVCLSNNKKAGNYHGSLFKITEDPNDPLKFTSETYYPGGKEFSCPDNIAFDSRGNLYLTCDISGKRIGKGVYKKFGNNGLFVIPISGKNAGKPIQIASAPNDAELTGLCFSPDEESLFLSVQHPGELTKDKSKPTSNWPSNKKGDIPRPSLVELRGPLLKNLNLLG